MSRRLSASALRSLRALAGRFADPIGPTPAEIVMERELIDAGILGDDGSGLTLLGGYVVAALLSEAEGITDADRDAARAATDRLLGAPPLKNGCHAAAAACARGLDDPSVERALFLDVLDAADRIVAAFKAPFQFEPPAGARSNVPSLQSVAVFARDWLRRHPLNVPVPGTTLASAPEGSRLRDLAVVAAAANAASAGSTRKGRFLLYPDSPRDDVVAWLKWNDPNGDFDDLGTLGAAWALLADVLRGLC